MTKNKNYFVGIGAPRCGTTWLASYLKKHPQVCFSPIKELHYFDSVYRPDLCGFFNEDFISQLRTAVFSNNYIKNTEIKLQIKCLLRRLEMINDKSVYKRYFDELLNDEKTFGEITPAYILLNRDGYEAINNMYPSAKYIVLLRNPIDSYWSNLKFFEKLHGKDKFCAKSEFEDKISEPKLYLRSDYKRALTELFTVTPRKNIKVLFYEDIFNSVSGNERIKELTDFLSIDYIQADTSEIINATFDENMDDKMRIIGVKKFKSTYDYIYENYDREIPKSWIKDFSKL